MPPTSPTAAAARVRERSPHADGAVGLWPVFLVQTALPHRDPALLHPQGAFAFTRTNGDRTLAIQAGARPGPDGTPTPLGVPYGSLARLLLVHFATQARLRDTRHVQLGPSLAHFLRSLKLAASGGRGGRIPYVRDQLRRLTACTFTVEHARPRAAHRFHVEGRHLVPAERFELWWDRREDDPLRAAPGGSITLGQALYDEIARAAVPVDLRKLHVLRASPLALDLYAWLTYSAGRLALRGRAHTAVPWDALRRQLSGYADTPEGRKEFARAARAALKRIRFRWPTLRVETPPGRLVLRTNRPDVPLRPRP